MTRDEKLKKVWSNMPRDYKGTTNGVKTVMIFRNGSTLVPLDALTGAEIAQHLPAKIVEAEVNRLASLATANNPVSVMKLGALASAVKEAFRDGLTDEEIIDIGREFIKKQAA